MATTFLRAAATAAIVAAAAVLAGADVARQDGVLVGSRFTYAVRAGDSLARLGARFAITPALLASRNGLAPNAPLRPDQTLEVDNRHVIPPRKGGTLTLNVAQRLLYFEGGDGLHAYPVGVGTRGWPTPLGAFTVIETETDPTWDVPVSIQEEMRRQGKPVITRMAPGPRNPLGARFIRLSFSNVGIHGTNEPTSLYRYVSHGCIRMHPEDIAALFPQVAVGMTGVSIYEPVLIAVSGGRVFLEAHPDAYRRAAAPQARARTLAESAGATHLVDWSLAAEVIRRQEGLAVDVTLAAQ